MFSSGRLKRKDNTICFDSDETGKKYIPVEQVDSISLFGEIDLNTKMINFAGSNGVILNFFNYYGFYSGSFCPRKKNVSGLLVVKQSQHYFIYEKRIELAKKFIEGAVFNILRNLRKHKDTTSDIIDCIEIERKNLKEVQTIEELMGVEGRIRKTYYKAFNVILKNGFKLEKRQKRPPTDPINALISFGNGMMYSTVLCELYKTQLDPTVSYLHEPSTKRFSLTLDISEIFKPIIVDSIIFSMVNNNMIKENDFDYMDEICYLNEIGKKKFIREFEKKLDTTIKHRSLNRSVSYRTFIKLECYKIIKHLIGDEIYKPLKVWW